MSKEKLFHVGVKGLIEDAAGKILLLNAPGWEKNGTTSHWDIPGGRVEEGGTVLETLGREIEEETGITEILDEEFMTAVISKHEIPLENGVTVGLVIVVYKVKIPVGRPITLSDEHIGFEWVDKAEAAVRLQNKYPEEFTSLLTA